MKFRSAANPGKVDKIGVPGKRRWQLALLLACGVALPAVAEPPAPEAPAVAPSGVVGRPRLGADVLAAPAPAADDSWIAWQRANVSGKERWAAQVYLSEGRTSSLGVECLTAKAVKPGGVQDLPALVPALTWSQELARGIAVQGSASQKVAPSWKAVEELKLQPQYGVSVQVTPDTAALSLPRMHLTCETSAKPTGPAAKADAPFQIEVAPTLQVQSGANSWLSTGFQVPIERGRSTPDSWQLNWSWRY